MGDYQPVIGLEIHVQLKTRTKMFCDSANDPDEKQPNVNVCPVCLGHPGALPVINKEAVRQVLRVGLALGGKPADDTEFDRKNYFYPDIPKGYQISQYEHPLVTSGELLGVAIRRIHLEEDTARSIHDADPDSSLVDFNRAGVPLMELVTEPVIVSAKQAEEFARELQLVLRYLNISDANMEKGELRIEANVSVSDNPNKLGTKVEIKNLNSFRTLRDSIEHEVGRQIQEIKEGKNVVQETRGSVLGVTFSQRQKESAHDYRYFPDPDLLPLKLSEVAEFNPPAGGLAATLPELPGARRERYRRNFGLKDENIELLVGEPALAEFFEAAAAELREPKLVKTAANFILNDIAGKRKEEPKWLPELNHFVSTIKLKLPSSQTKSSILSGAMVEVAAADSLPALVAAIIAANPKVAADYRAGKAAALQFLVGQAMKQSRGGANPEILQQLFRQHLSSRS